MIDSGFRGTVEDFVGLARAEGFEFAHMLEVHPGRFWLLVSGTPTERLRGQVWLCRPAGIEITVASFDQMDEIVGGLVEKATAVGFAIGKRDRWWLRTWLELQRLMR